MNYENLYKNKTVHKDYMNTHKFSGTIVLNSVNRISMCRHIVLALMLTLIISCSKEPEVERTNFAEITVDGKKFTFDKFEAIVAKGDGYVGIEFTFNNTTSNSHLSFYLESFSKLVNTYRYGDRYPTPYISWMHLQTYINKFPETYELIQWGQTVIIDKDKEGRIHGTLSGKITCYTCVPNKLVDISGEFELAYSFR